MFVFLSVLLQKEKEWEWEITMIQKGGRIDAIADFGDGILVLGTRDPNPGNVYRSEDFGKSWTKAANIVSDDYITCIAGDKNGIGYILTGNKIHVWKTEDFGITWRDLGKVSDGKNTEGFGNAYGMLVTDDGTILVSDANSGGGQVLRSDDGGKNWTSSGKISNRALYRLQKVGDGIIVNGWAGHVYKSKDGGETWTDCGKLTDSPLYAIEYLGNNEVLIGSESGNIFKSADNGENWKNLGVVSDAADDFAYFGNRNVLYTTYNKEKKMFLSKDNGETWTDIGNTGTSNGDWFDHVIAIQNDSSKIIVGGTNKGFVLRHEIK